MLKPLLGLLLRGVAQRPRHIGDAVTFAVGSDRTGRRSPTLVRVEPRRFGPEVPKPGSPSGGCPVDKLICAPLDELLSVRQPACELRVVDT